MHLHSLRLRRFRNFADTSVHLEPGLTVFHGDNAQGKTNLLESIYYLATGRSFRTTRDEECVPFGSEPGAAAVVEGSLTRGGVRHDIRIAFTRQTKIVRVDDKPLARLTDLWGVLATVLFTPEDLQTVLGGPSGRRQYIDVALSQVDHYYLDALKRYTRALRQRNALLRRPGHLSDKTRAQVEAYEGPLADAAGRIFTARRDFIARVVPLAARRHVELAGREEILTGRYDHFLQTVLDPPDRPLDAIADREATALFASLLAKRRDDDVARQQTIQGPHRDDLFLLVDGREARAFASQGQARTTALSLRLAEADFIRETAGHAPLLLLDDILSELDPRRLDSLLSSLASADIQTILTTTDLEPLRSVLGRARAWRVEQGRVIPPATATATPAAGDATNRPSNPTTTESAGEE
jgi:DNA replication and repair protein RecF